MKKIVFAVVLATCAVAPVAAQSTDAPAKVRVSVSQQLFDAEGKRVGSVYRVTPDGSAQLIIDDGRLVTVPVATLAQVGNKLTTSLKRREVTARR